MVDRNPGNPSDPSNPDRNRESERQLRALLMSWDPIGVVDDPEAEDEYDCMVAPLLQQLYDAPTVEVLYS